VKVNLPDALATQLLIEALDSLATHPIQSAAAFRNLVLSDMAIMAINPMIDINDTAMAVAQDMFDGMRRAVKDGRMIDFGFVPNATIKAESLRARDAFEGGDLVHPYDEWVGVMAWEGGFNAYCVSQPPDKDGVVSVIEMYGVRLPPVDVLLLYDVSRIEIRDGQTYTQLAPLNYPDELDTKALRDGFDLGRVANTLDPLVTMLRLLADASIPISRFTAPPALNKARARKGKPPIPDHSIVHCHDYVSQLKAHGSRTQGVGAGHHASPVAHWRRSHLRHLSDERVVKVRSSRVNWREPAELHRLFSIVQRGDTQHEKRRSTTSTTVTDHADR
jgi:hypothetical protein